MQDGHDKHEFLKAIRDSLAGNAFLKCAISKYRGPTSGEQGEPRHCSVSRVLLKDVVHLRFVTRQGSQDITHNLETEAGITHIAELIGGDYLSATLFTTGGDMSLVYNRKRIAQLTRSKPSLSEAPPIEHNRSKSYLVDVSSPYLAQLGVTHGGDQTTGKQAASAAAQQSAAAKQPQVKPSMYAKFRQICRFVEIVDQLIAASPLKNTSAPKIVDIGSGKGYLTFALHEHLLHRLGKAPQTLGLEITTGLVDQCNTIAAACAIQGLSFEATRAENWSAAQHCDGVDILIALHACDTATDDAIHVGISRNASLILCAPCCQHEIAPQLSTAGSPIEGLLKFGLLRQRQADLVTDAARALLLEMHGYAVRIIEFVSTEHSGKNLMIAAVRDDKVDRKAAALQYASLAAFAGFEQQRLNRLLGPQ